MEKEIRVVIIEPDKPSYRKTIPNTLEAFQDIVGGYIEVVPLPGNIRMIVNEEGKLLLLPKNRAATELYRSRTDYIAGTAIIVATRGEGFTSLDNVTAAFYEDLE
ncbi:MAG: DUF3846 domain-containing protein [Ruminiclostridium sp.]